jgi:hypothetical protein
MTNPPDLLTEAPLLPSVEWSEIEHGEGRACFS